MEADPVLAVMFARQEKELGCKYCIRLFVDSPVQIGRSEINQYVCPSSNQVSINNRQTPEHKGVVLDGRLVLGR